MKVYNNILELIGNTPIVKINNINTTKANIFVKMESFNPFSSAKDRVGLAMVERAEKEGILKKGGVIIEPTSGNTGIALAGVAAVKGYKLILTMPETMSVERRMLLASLGAEIVLTEGARGMNGAVEKAKELLKEMPNAFMPQQFENDANSQIHYETTAKEIFESMGGKIDCFISAVGTGGTITGVGRYLKEMIKDVKIIAVEPEASPVLSGGKPAPHKIQGIGAGFIPKVLDTNIYDEIIQVSNEDAFTMAKRLAKEEAILSGISSGAAMQAAMSVAERKEYENKNIVAMLPDTFERYLSVLS